MAQPELLKPQENLRSSPQEAEHPVGSIDKDEVEAIYHGRRNSLERIRMLISLKFYHQIGEKLQEERKQFQNLLNLQDAKQETLSHYSFVLNPYYFEQKFLN